LYQEAVKGGELANGRPTQIKVGHSADWVVLNPNELATYTLNPETLLDTWIFGSRSLGVKDVCVGGVWVIQNGHHIRENQIIDAYKKAFSLEGANTDLV
jgi:formimidoylglutamate deiminase